MTLKELGTEYRQSAEPLYKRIKELKLQACLPEVCEMERFRIRGRISELMKMYHDVCVTALFLERYYEGR